MKLHPGNFGTDLATPHLSGRPVSSLRPSRVSNKAVVNGLQQLLAPAQVRRKEVSLAPG